MGTYLGFQAIGKSVGIGLPIKTTGTARVQPGTTQHSSFLITPYDRDFELDDYGNKKGMDDTRQRVLLCIRTLANTRKNFPDFGLTLPKKIQTGQLKQQIQEAVRKAMRPVIEDGSVTLESVEVDSKDTTVYALIWWHNNRTKESQSESVPLRR